MKKIISVICIVLSAFVLSSCYTLKWCNIHPEWNPPKGYDWANAQCKARSNTASGYDWVETSRNRVNAYNACMASYGYELRKIYSEQKEERDHKENLI